MFVNIWRIFRRSSQYYVGTFCRIVPRCRDTGGFVDVGETLEWQDTQDASRVAFRCKVNDARRNGTARVACDATFLHSHLVTQRETHPA